MENEKPLLLNEIEPLNQCGGGTTLKCDSSQSNQFFFEKGGVEEVGGLLIRVFWFAQNKKWNARVNLF
ncbi:MAG: hypothetical protein Q8O62_07460 [Aequorivita sp.]|nr:hypothetical protein [Aequorivita sp.]